MSRLYLDELYELLIGVEAKILAEERLNARGVRTLRIGTQLVAESMPDAPPRRNKKYLDHGTDDGYYYHRRNGIPIDEEDTCGCRAAHALAERIRKRKRQRRKDDEADAAHARGRVA